MIVTLTLAFLYWLVVHALFYWTAAHWFNLYVTLFLALLYLPSYFDGKEHTGERQWGWLRRWRLWQRLSPVVSMFANHADLNAVDHRSMRLYVLLPGKTLAALVWGLGLHGGALSPFAERMHWTVPPALMWVPLLRDVLLWMGAVTWHPRRLTPTDLILQLLRANRSVCYSPLALSPLLAPRIELDVELFEFALNERVQLVPVMVHGEDMHYRTLAPRWGPLQRIQAWTYANLGGYTWPHLVWPRHILRRGEASSSSQIVQSFGPIIQCTTRHSTAQELARVFCDGMQSLSCPETGEEAYQIGLRGAVPIKTPLDESF